MINILKIEVRRIINSFIQKKKKMRKRRKKMRKNKKKKMIVNLVSQKKMKKVHITMSHYSNGIENKQNYIMLLQRTKSSQGIS